MDVVVVVMSGLLAGHMSRLMNACFMAQMLDCYERNMQRVSITLPVVLVPGTI